MPDKESTKYKHLTEEERLEIQQCLDHGMTFKAIGKRIGKDQTTISKEVKKHLQTRGSEVKRLNEDGTEARREVCPDLLKSPFVCNPCNKRHANCGRQKQFYIAKKAESEYKFTLSDAREGIPLNKADFYETDRIVTSGIKRGQHLYHIMQTNKLKVSKTSVYRYLHKGYLSVAALDFPRVVKFKPRNIRREKYIPKTAKIGRTYSDFISYTQENNITSWVEMDTVIGRVGGKTILTMDFTICNFMIGILLDDKTAAEVTEKIKRLKATLNQRGLKFGDIFPLALTDNGGEFANIWAIENSLAGEKETSLFFCDPCKSCQKPKVEKNHTIFRDIVPKGSSFDSFTQETVDLIFSHVNGVKRKILNGKSPYEFFSFVYGEHVAAALGISFIPDVNVLQSPLLLKVI